jgi:serine/threonine protein kinase
MNWMRIRDLAQLCNSIPAPESDRLRFLKEYCKDDLRDKKNFYALNVNITHVAGKLEQRRIKSRSKRCRKNSTLFEVKGWWHESYCIRKDFGLRACYRAIDYHKSTSHTNERAMLKQSSKSILTTHKSTKDIPLPVCVKGYRFMGSLYALKNILRKSRAMKSWIAGNSLMVRGVSTPMPQAILERKWGPLVLESFLITEWISGTTELNDYISGLHNEKPIAIGKKRKTDFIYSLARTIRKLHAMGVYHADLKSNNILVQESGDAAWTFYFVDLDRVKFRRFLSFRERANNLAQINASVSELMSVKDRLKFFHLYAEETLLLAQRKKYYREILNISRTKITEPFGVSFKTAP